jgi:hypothetical protein
MSLKAFGEGHQGAGGAPVAGATGTSGVSEPMTDEAVREVARKNVGPGFSEQHPIMVNGNLTHPKTFMALPSDRSHSDWDGLTGKVERAKSTGPAAPAAPKVVKEGNVGDARPHPVTGEREEITGHGPDGKPRWESMAESPKEAGHVTNMKGFSVPMESVGEDEMGQIKERNRQLDAASASLGSIRTRGGAKLTIEQQATASANTRSGGGGRTARVRTPRPPTPGQQAASEQASGASLTRKPWSSSAEGANNSIVDIAHQHLAHLEGFLSTHRDAIAADSDEAKGHGLNAAVHLQAARLALSDAVQAKGGGRIHAVNENGEKQFHKDGTPKMVNAPQDDIGANSHIKAATDAIRIAHAALNEPSIIRAAKDIPEAAAGGTGSISPTDNHGATRGLRGYAGSMGKMPKHFRIAGQNFASKDPFLHEQLSRIALGIASGDRDYTHLTEVFNQTNLGRLGRTRKGAAAWTGETSPERAGRGRVGEVGQPGQPTGFGVGTVPKTQADLDRIAKEDAMPSSDRAPKPGKTQAERIAESNAEAERIRGLDKEQGEKREADLDAERAADPNHPNSKTPEQREVIRARVAEKLKQDSIAERTAAAEAQAEKIEARRTKDRERRAKKKLEGK